MPFTPMELREVVSQIGGFCRRRMPVHLSDQIRLNYTVQGFAVLITEARPGWRNSTEWSELDVAKLKYVRSQDEWRLYWKRANGKWMRYEPRRPSGKLATLIKEMDQDDYGCFFG